MKVKPNLFLNMSPQTTEEGGLAFARNMKLDDDGNLVSDYGYKDITALSDKTIVGHIVGLDNKIYFFCHNKHQTEDTPPVTYYIDEIVEYDEDLETATTLTTQWTYGGGEIDGYVNTNQSGEKILTIAEYKEGVDIPLKHINLDPKYSNVEESLYCQAPICPTANLVIKDTYVKTIPNGVYVFFIRYKIRKDVYTNWFICSRPIFGGTSENITTLQGGLSCINLHKDSAKSFIFQLNFVQTANISSYKEFQLGFIITHDEATDARTWKHFDISNFVNDRNPYYHEEGHDDENIIYFDYENVEEASIDDLLETTYELYNVRNVTAFKNRLYISNYKESNFNPDLTDFVSKISISYAHTNASDELYRNMIFNEHSLSYNSQKGFYDGIIDEQISIKSLFTKSQFNFDVTTLVKLDSKEKSKVLQFELYFNAQHEPDLAVIYNIHNNLYNKEVFGNDYIVSYGNVFSCINLIRTYEDEWLYRQNDNNLHPWYNLDLTFMYGSTPSVIYLAGKKLTGCWLFNKNSKIGYIKDDPINKGWFAEDRGFKDSVRNAIQDNIDNEITNKGFFAKAYIQVTSGANVYNIGYEDIMDLDNYAGYNNDLDIIDNSLCNTNNITQDFYEYVRDQAYNIIENKTVGLDENGVIVLDIDGTLIRCNSINVVFKKFEFEVDSNIVESSTDIFKVEYNVTLKTTDYSSLCTFNIKEKYIKTNTIDTKVKQTPTLMPLSTYMIYGHFVDEHNIITNGILLNTITTDNVKSNADVLYLTYNIDDDIDTSKYKSLFLSIVNTGDIVIEGFGYSKILNNSTINILHCLELDTLLYNLNDNITIKDENGNIVTDNAKYYSSGSSYPILAFGNCGYVSWESSNDYSNNKLYIIVTRNTSYENINTLQKASGYIKLEYKQDEPVPDGYYGSWLCLVKKPSFDLSSSVYVSGNDIYNINRNTALKLIDFKNYIQVQSSPTYFIRSNFNLNYLSLTEDITDRIFSIGGSSSGVKQVAKVINSATLSFIYELKSMYRDFANKYFRCKDDEYKIQFDNTVRVSHVLSDEMFNNSVFKFASADYYNIPTDRGIIVNLFSIGNNIFVHCKSSLYKFDGNATIAANDKDIQLQSSEPFDAGISQIIDSEYGYGGINTKQSGCITFDSYFFYDQASNHIFAYGGNSQIQLIDANIYKLLAHYRPSECKALHDEANCRVLFEFTSGRSEHENANYKTFTLSYNYKTKTFVSFHDISLINTFASRHKAYSYKSALINLFNTENIINTSPIVKGMNINKIFGGATTACIIEFGSQIYKKQASPFGIAVVLFPQANLKETVDSIKYVADVQQLDPETQITPVYDVLVNPQVTRNNPVTNFYIITDSCVSNLVTTNVDDTARPNSLLDYKGFKYDMGFWTSNYFRNNINKTNIYSYPQKYPNRALDADNSSLIYGRYFILVFDFKPDTPIKFEDVYMNTNKY